MNVIFQKTINFDLKDFPSETRIPAMFFKKPDEIFSNTRSYLPPELQIDMNNPKVKNSSNNLTNERPKKVRGRPPREIGIGPNETDARVRFCFNF